MEKVFSREIAGREMRVTIGKVAEQANGAASNASKTMSFFIPFSLSNWLSANINSSFIRPPRTQSFDSFLR